MSEGLSPRIAQQLALVDRVLSELSRFGPDWVEARNALIELRALIIATASEAV